MAEKIKGLHKDRKIRYAIVAICVTCILFIGKSCGWVKIESSEDVDEVIESANTIVDETIHIKEKVKGEEEELEDMDKNTEIEESETNSSEDKIENKDTENGETKNE